MQNIVFAGNAITAEILYGYLKNDSRYHVLASVVDDEYVETGTFKDVPCFSFSDLASKFAPDTCKIMMAIGYDRLNEVRESMFSRLKALGYSIETYMHPAANVFSPNIGEGCMIFPGAVVEPCATVGQNSFLWCNTTVAHHARLGDNCWLAAGAVIAGDASVGKNTFIGVNATIVNKVAVAEYNIIGASVLVSKDTKGNSVYLARSGELHRFSANDYAKYMVV